MQNIESKNSPSRFEGVGCETARGSANSKTHSHSVLDTESPKKVPKLRFKEFTSLSAGSGEWVEKSLGSAFNILQGYAFSSNDSLNDGIRWIKIADVGIQQMKHGTPSYLPFEYKKKHSKYLIKANDYVLALTRPILNGKLKLAKVDKVFNNSLLNQRVGKLISTQHLDYIYYLMQQPCLINQIDNLILGSEPPNLSINQIKPIKINLPTLPEQQKIADCLSTWDESIENLKSLIENKKLYKKGMMQKLFSQELRFKEDDGSDFPEWVEKKLGEVCDIKKGSQLNKDTLTKEGSYPALNGGINPSGYTDNWNTEANTITISEGGNSCGYVNFVNSRFWSGGHNYSLQRLKKLINVNYLYQYLKVNELDIMRLRVGSGLPNIQKGDIFNFKINFPTISEQTKIANFLSAIDDDIELLEQELEQLQLQKKGLMQGMFV